MEKVLCDREGLTTGTGIEAMAEPHKDPERLCQFLPEIAGCAASEMVQKLIAWASLYLGAGPPEDDISLIVMKVADLS
jgi:hypothetical protein